MRTSALTGFLFVACGFATQAQQLTLLPQVGMEISRTTITYNNLGSFAPLRGEFSPIAGFKLDYTFRQGFGPYLAVSTSRSIVAFRFSDPENGMNIYQATQGDMQLRFEGGYQFSTKPIYFNKSKQTPAKATQQKSNTGKNCSSRYTSRSHCTKNYSSSTRCGTKTTQTVRQVQKNKGNWVRIQPSAGVGWIPAVKNDVETKTMGGQTTYEYRAGNWNTAFMTGAGFEFGKNKQRLFLISINYYKGLGNLNRQTITSVSGSKTTVTHLQSDVSGWNMKVGIPFTLLQKKPVVIEKSEYKTNKPASKCSQYRIEYKYRCRSMQ